MSETLTQITPEEVLDRYYSFKLSKARPSRAGSTRASSLGHPCTAHIVFERIAGEKAEMPDKTLACIFAEGRLQEHGVLGDLHDMGFEIVESQRTVHWDKYQITGHIDGKLFREGSHPRPFEVKSISPYGFAKLNTQEEIRDSRAWYYKKWYAQIQLYMLLESEESYWLILKSKTTGEVKIITFTLDLEFAESLIKKAETIQQGVESYKDLSFADWIKPHRLNDPDICSECPFKSICLPEIDSGAGARFLSDPDMPDKIARHEELKPLSREYDELHTEITDRAKKVFEEGQTDIIAGDWHIRGKKQDRKGKIAWGTTIEKIALGSRGD